MQARGWLVAAGVLGAVGVAMGAYVSHGLGFIAEPAAREVARAALSTAVQQHMLHVLALLGVGAVALRAPSRWLTAASALFVLGILLFSGLVYARWLLGFDALRAMVPWGGTCLILGWLSVAVAACKLRTPA